MVVAIGCTSTPATVNITLPSSFHGAPDMATRVAPPPPGIVIFPTSGLRTTSTGGAAIFKVALATPPTADVVIALSSSDSTQGTVSPTKLTFTSGNSATAQTVTVTGVDDFIINGNHAYTINLAPASSADPAYNGLKGSDVSVTNFETDVPGFVVTPTSGLMTQPGVGGTTAQFSVRLETEPTANVTYTFDSNNHNQGTVAPMSLTFTTANWKMPQVVTVTGVDDNIVEGDITYQIVAQPATSGDMNYNGVTAPTVTVVNKEIDTLGVVVTPTTGLTTNTAGANSTFNIKLHSEPAAGATVTVGVVSNDTSKGTMSAPSVALTQANWSTGVNVTVTGVVSHVAAANTTYTVTVASPTATGDPNYNNNPALTPTVLTVQYVNTNVAGFSVSRSSLSAYEGQTDSFTIALTTQPTANVSLPVSTNNGSLSSGGTITFTTSNWNTAQTITWFPTANTVVDGTKSGTLSFGSASGASEYVGKTTSNISLTDLDDDKDIYASGTAFQWCTSPGAVGCSPNTAISLPVGGTVNYRWDGSAHTIASQAASAPAGSGLPSPAGAAPLDSTHLIYSGTTSARGTFPFQCTFHSGQDTNGNWSGMIGTMTVF